MYLMCIIQRKNKNKAIIRSLKKTKQKPQQKKSVLNLNDQKYVVFNLSQTGQALLDCGASSTS